MKWKYKIAVILVIGCMIAGLMWWFVSCIRQSEVGIEVDQQINITPEQVTSIKAIGEWEFLSIASEELVDTVRKGFLSNDYLVRIYYGTIRLGINMHQVEPGWIRTSDDNIVITLPAPSLIDRDFIDETKTKSFYETGKWSHKDREALYQKAYQQMLTHCLTQENLSLAQSNGESQFKHMMKVMGYNHVIIHWGKK